MTDWQPNRNSQLSMSSAALFFGVVLALTCFHPILYNPHSDALMLSEPWIPSNSVTVVRVLVDAVLQALPAAEVDTTLKILSARGLPADRVQQITTRLRIRAFPAPDLELVKMFEKRGIEPRLIAAAYGIRPQTSPFTPRQPAPYPNPLPGDGLDAAETNYGPTHPGDRPVPPVPPVPELSVSLDASATHESHAGSKKKRKYPTVAKQLESGSSASSYQDEIQAEQMPQRVVRLPNVYGMSGASVEASTEQQSVPFVPPPSRVPFWTLPAESYTILSTLYESPDVKIIAKRVDHVPSHLSLQTGLMRTTLVVRFNQAAQGGVQCSAGESRSKLNVFFPHVEAWCSQLLSWAVATAPELLSNIGDTPFAVSIVFKKELICNAVQLPKFKGQRVINHEVLWGCFEDWGPLALPKDLQALLTSWSRVVIVQSRRISSKFRDYITEQYLHQASAASKFVEKAEKACPVEELVLKQSPKLSNVVVRWPPGFTFNYVYQATLPICLAVYPVNTYLDFDLRDPTNPDAPHHVSYVCDASGGFVAQTTAQLPKA